MTGIISGIKRMEIHDGDGLRTTVFFKGCPLRCIWCHNPESLSQRREIAFFRSKCIGCGECTSACPRGAVNLGRINRDVCIGCSKCVGACPTSALEGFGEEWDSESLFRKVMQDEPFFRESGGGVTLSGGECLIQADFAVELAERFFKAGISVNVDTCGAVARETIDKILHFTHTFLYDVKTFDPELHRKLTGCDNSLILDNLNYISKQNANIEIIIPLVKGYNDGEIPKIAELLAAIRGVKKVKVLKYHSLAASRYEALGRRNTLPDAETKNEDIDLAVEILRSHGLNAVNGARGD